MEKLDEVEERVSEGRRMRGTGEGRGETRDSLEVQKSVSP